MSRVGEREIGGIGWQLGVEFSVLKRVENGLSGGLERQACDCDGIESRVQDLGCSQEREQQGEQGPLTWCSGSRR